MTRIRRATTDDAAALAELAERTFRDTFTRENRAEDIEEYVAKAYCEAQQRRELADPNALTLLVESDGELVAFAQLRLGEGELEIARFYVDGAHHGRGLAQQLMEAVKEIARERGAARVWLGVWERNFRAIRFYEKCGFVDIGSQPFLLGSDLQTDRVMAYVMARS